MADFGHWCETTIPRAQTGRRTALGFAPVQAQFLSCTKPLDRHSSHLHAAGEENWKWNAIRSFFFLLLKGLIRSERLL